MQGYVLEPDEVLFWEGNVDRNNKDVNMKLTNYALIFSWTEKRGHFRNKVVEEMVDICPIDAVKVFNNAPQIKQAANEVTIQTTQGDEKIVFEGFFKARTFCAKLRELITGQTTSERGAKKVDKAFSLVDDALGIDTRETFSGVVQNGVVGTVLGGIGSKKKSKAEAVSGTIETAANILLSEKETIEEQPSVSYEDQIKLLKSLNELKEQGILTQEEFDAKKKEILGL